MKGILRSSSRLCSTLVPGNPPPAAQVSNVLPPHALKNEDEKGNHKIIYHASKIDASRIRTHTLCGLGLISSSMALEAAKSVPEYPFWDSLPSLTFLLSLAYMGWRHKVCRDLVSTLSYDVDRNEVGIQGVSLWGNPLQRVDYFSLSNLSYFAPGSEMSNDFFYVGVDRGESFRLFRLEHVESVERLFNVQPEQVKHSKKVDPSGILNVNSSRSRRVPPKE